MFKKFGKFLADVKRELKLVSWPNKDDLKEGTTVVVIMSSLVAVFLSLVDLMFKFLMQNVIFKG